MARRRNPKSVKNFAPGTTEGNSLVYLEIRIGTGRTKRLHIELLNEIAPKTCSNFRMLCTGQQLPNVSTKPVSYVNNRVHRIIPGFMMQAGDITLNNGTGGKCVFGGNFIDEHGRGSVSMAHQNNTNSSQFFICFNDDVSWLDGKHVVFGQVVAEDLAFISQLEKLGTDSGRPSREVVIVKGGQVCGEGFEVPQAS